MSDIVNPRVENYYIHPKKYAKYAWRADNRLSPENNKLTDEKSELSEVIKSHLKMGLNPNYKTDSIQENGISHKTEESQDNNQVPQDGPLDFSVKTVDHNNHARHSEFELSQSPIKDDGKISNQPEFSSNYLNIKKSVAVPMYSSKVTSSEPIYNGNSKYQRPKQRHMNGSIPGYSENSQEIQSPTQNTSVFHSNRVKFSQFQNSNHHRQDMNEESFDCDGPNSQGQTSNLSVENSPENRSYSGSILQEVLARHSGGRSPMNGVSSHVKKSSPSASDTKPLQGTVPPFFATNSVLPDTGSLLPNATAIYPSSPIMANYALLNSFGYPAASINDINPFSNVNMPSVSVDSKIFQTPVSSDKKSCKPLRPFKALSNELMYGIPLPSVTGVMSNGGYFKEYFQRSVKDTTESPKNNSVLKKELSEVSANSTINSSPSSNGAESKPDVTGSGDSNSSYPDASGSVVERAESTSNGNNRKRNLPVEVKDEAYWERRRKNNQAAKRSRDARRQKEDMVAQQAWLFREHNYQLKLQIEALNAQNRHFQIQNHAAMEQCRNLELQLRLANEKLAQTRCGKCGSRLRNDNSENSLADPNANE